MTTAGAPTGVAALPSLLSQALVAFAVEFDNEAEQRLAHTTTSGREGSGPWLVSMAPWANVLRHLPAEGCPLAELQRRSGTARSFLSGLRRWGYVTVTPGGRLRPTRHTRAAQPGWAAVAEEVEARWLGRHGPDLRAALEGVAGSLDPSLPDFLPMVMPAQGGWTEQPLPDACRPAAPAEVPLWALLGRTLQSLTLAAEAVAPVALAIGANTLRVVAPDGTAQRQLPALTGVSREANAMVVGWLTRRDLVSVVPDPAGGRGKVVVPTGRGAAAQPRFARTVAEAATAWAAPRPAAGTLASVLTVLVGDGPGSPVWAGLVPPPGGWRARVRPPSTLPHHPMVLHRGGYPDGA